jgi:hypothetical protein
MRIKALVSGIFACALFAGPVTAESFEVSPRTLQPIAASGELLMAQSGPRFYDYDDDDYNGRGRYDGRDRYDRYDRWDDCHRRADRHRGIRGLHRHVGRVCRIQFLRPVRNPYRDQYCVMADGVRFCAG